MLINELFEKKSITLKTNNTAWVILYTNNKVILGKRAPSTNNPNQWNFFGGHIDQGESAIDAAVRELKEETGYKISASSLKELTTIGKATYFVAKIGSSSSVKTTQEISKVSEFKLTNLPDNLHSKTQNFFDQLDHLFT